MTRLIAFTGKIDSGKSTAARVLLDEYNYKITSFAYPVKSMLLALGLSHEQVYGSLKEKSCTLLCGKSPRFAMRTLGTEWGRQMIGKEIWVNAWKQNASAHLMLNIKNKVVVEDCRHIDEVEAIKKLGGKIFQITRRGQVDIGPTAHSSDIPLPEHLIDTMISNGTDLDSFKEFIKFLFKEEDEDGQT